MHARRILILGGTQEAADLARRLSDREDLDVVTSLAGRTARPSPVAGRVRTGGFGGAEGLARFLAEAGVDLLVDATHPFATAISANAATAAERTATPRLTFLRPEWKPEPGDRWTEADDLDAAARALPSGARALLALGRQHIAAFAHRTDCFFVVRTVDPPGDPLPLAAHAVVVGRPGKSPASEAALLRAHAVDHVVCRNSGGAGGWAKLVAARDLGLPVTMIRRPPPPPGRIFDSLDDLVAAIG